jgi:hypothetical protein
VRRINKSKVPWSKASFSLPVFWEGIRHERTLAWVGCQQEVSLVSKQVIASAKDRVTIGWSVELD